MLSSSDEEVLARDAAFPTQPLSKQHAARPLLMLVDDQISNLLLLSEIFKGDYEVCLSQGGAEALTACRSRLPDLILLDVMMPEMSGYSLCQLLKSDPQTWHIPVIFITAAKQDAAAEASALDLGAVDFILKPFHVRVVRARVRAQLSLKYQADALRELALVDALTGVANRRQFDQVLDAEWRRSIRSGETLSLILIDVDFFKKYNDQHGHPAGDVCLKAIASAIKLTLTRSHDLVARYGGEEFVCVLPDTTLEGAVAKATQMEKAVRALALEHGNSEVCGFVTISLGVASTLPVQGDLAAGLVSSADGELYLAKQLGRGQVQSLSHELARSLQVA
jgi:diguanylate cyclase (GGDEF)-like protein